MGNFNFGLVAHELGHMWFGDNVTCASWSDIWINEGFATYTDYLAREKFIHLNVGQLQPGTYLIRVNEPAGSYSRKFIKAD